MDTKIFTMTQQNINIYKIGFFIVVILLLIAVGYYIDRKFVQDAYIQGRFQGQADIVNRNGQGFVTLFNPQTNQTYEMTIQQICGAGGGGK